MKKHYGQIILAGILCAVFFRDSGPGYILAFVYGIVIGIPLYVLINLVLNLLFPNKEKRSEIVARIFSIVVIFLIFWLTYYPPAPILFKRLISNPIPESVSNLKSASSIDGPSDCSHYVKFNINRDDLNKIIQSKKLIPASITVQQLSSVVRYELTPSNSSNSFSISIDRPRFRLGSFENAEAFVMDDREEYFSEYIIHDPNTNEALYLYYN